MASASLHASSGLGRRTCPPAQDLYLIIFRKKGTAVMHADPQLQFCKLGCIYCAYVVVNDCAGDMIGPSKEAKDNH